jgi:elongator complex protein 2
VPVAKALSASVPALGLSNKAVYTDSLDQEPLLADNDRKPKLALKQPPVEDDLLQNTLWPETQKLYGHGFEIFCLAVHTGKRLLASACKASKAEHAVIRLWDCDSWKQLQSLSAHSLTVTQMAFSNSGDRLLAVSRDRTWSVWCLTKTDENRFVLEQHADKKVAVHSRIIWTCSWSPDDKYFATGSRDKKAIVWGDGGDSVKHWSPASSVLEAKDAVTAIDFCPQLLDLANGVYMLAIGLESGQVSIYSWQCGNSDQTCWSKLLDFNSSLSHTACVKQVQWQRPPLHSEEPKDNSILLATCGDDYAVKIVKCSFDVNSTSS